MPQSRNETKDERYLYLNEPTVVRLLMVVMIRSGGDVLCQWMS